MSVDSSRLRVVISGIAFRNPVILASGVLGNTSGLIRRVVLEGGAGGATFKTLTLKPREGYRNPVVAVVKVGVINCMGLPNPGLEDGLREIKEVKEVLPEDVPLIASFASSDPKEAQYIASELEGVGVDAIELNLSCPHAKGLGASVSQDLRLTEGLVRSVKSVIKLPLFVKLGLQDNVIELGKVVERGGADAVVAINTVKAMAIDIYARKPILSNVYGGLSGPAIHPIAVRVVYDLYENLSIPIIGVGGVEDWVDAVELILAGANAVEVGTAIYTKGITVFREICEGIMKYLEDEGFSSVGDLVGLAHKR